MSLPNIPSCVSLFGQILQMLPKFSNVPVNLQILSWASIIFYHAQV